MAITTAQLTINQGATFRQALNCDLSDRGIADIQAWPGVTFTFALSVGLKGDSNFASVCSGTASAAVNVVTIDIDEAVTALITAIEGKWVLEASNGTDRWRIGEGAWFLHRNTA